MQITDTYSGGTFLPSPSGDASARKFAADLRRQHRYHRLIRLRRATGFWWYRLLLIVLAGLASPLLAPLLLASPKIFFGGMGAIVLIFFIARYADWGLLLIAIFATAFFPAVLQVKSLSASPVQPLIILLFCILVVQIVFRVREPVFPSCWSIWPWLGIILLAFVSQIMVQFTWTHTVPHKINNNPIYYDEIFGIALFFFPLITISITTICVSSKERLIEYVQRAYLILAVFAALIIFYEFRRIGATIYSFRFADPTILWMSLRALAQLLALGGMIAYARFLYATTWRRRLIFFLALVCCLGGVYLTLENSWWLELGLALLVMTIAYSRRLLVFCCIAMLPLLPVVKSEFSKLQQVKSADSFRLIIWQDALRVWSKQPLLGVGPGNFWAYDQRFTQLPFYLRDFNKTGLGVAHNGFLQVLGELGPIGLFFYLSFIAVIIVVSVRMFRRSQVQKITTGKNRLRWLDLHYYVESEQRLDRMLALVGLGLICGSAVGDFFAGSFFLQPRQIGGFNDLPQVLTSWLIWGCVLYKDQIWRMARKKLRYQGKIAAGI
ncbi:MAG TPA: O-antigen ligase family protein [Ktedonobacteraceae bacterium]